MAEITYVPTWAGFLYLAVVLDAFSRRISIEFGHRCREAGVRPSMGSVGDANDNAMCESFFATLECELLDRCRLKTQTEARSAVFAFILQSATPYSSIGYFSRLIPNTGIMQQPTIATHTSLPPCSRPSRTSPSGAAGSGRP